METPKRSYRGGMPSSSLSSLSSPSSSPSSSSSSASTSSSSSSSSCLNASSSPQRHPDNIIIQQTNTSAATPTNSHHPPSSPSKPKDLTKAIETLGAGITLIHSDSPNTSPRPTPGPDGRPTVEGIWSKNHRRRSSSSCTILSTSDAATDDGRGSMYTLENLFWVNGPTRDMTTALDLEHDSTEINANPAVAAQQTLRRFGNTFGFAPLAVPVAATAPLVPIHVPTPILPPPLASQESQRTVDAEALESELYNTTSHPNPTAPVAPAHITLSINETNFHPPDPKHFRIPAPGPTTSKISPPQHQSPTTPFPTLRTLSPTSWLNLQKSTTPRPNSPCSIQPQPSQHHAPSSPTPTLTKPAKHPTQPKSNATLFQRLMNKKRTMLVLSWCLFLVVGASVSTLLRQYFSLLIFVAKFNTHFSENRYAYPYTSGRKNWT
ncbi:hypothetical protein HDU97_004844 [Phlyctochytrium planicorne]|nr:hypothetical protein HDU97_004844 [Phlyctochytrium planicorne]